MSTSTSRRRESVIVGSVAAVAVRQRRNEGSGNVEATRRRCRWFLCAVAPMLLNSIALDSRAAESAKAELEQGIADLKWGMSSQEILSVYPEGKKREGAFAMISVQQPKGILGIRTLKDGIGLHMVDGKLNSAMLIVDGPNAALFVRTMNGALGDPRSFVEKSAFGTYTHIYEWSTPAAGASITYTTTDGRKESVPQGSTISARIQGRPITESLIDAAREMNEQTARPRQ